MLLLLCWGFFTKPTQPFHLYLQPAASDSRVSEISIHKEPRKKKMHLSVSPNTQSSFNPTITTINTLLSSSSSSSSSFHTKNPFFFQQQQHQNRSISSSSSKKERVVFQSDYRPIVVLTREYEGLRKTPDLRSEEQKRDGFYMKRCIEVAKKGMGYTCPDPMVGCVIVKDNAIVGEGFYTKNTHLYPGGVGTSDDGAEIMALKEAGDLAKGARAYVNLNHSNISSIKTELILAGVKDVVPGNSEWDEWSCKKLNELSIHRKLSGKPLIALRCSVSLNGRILDHLGEGANECGGYYSQLLQEYDGIIVSNASLLKQHSFPTSKEVGAKQPMQIIVTRTPSHPNPRYSPHVETMATIKSMHGQEQEEEVLALDSIFRSDFRETVISKNLRTIIDHCAGQGLSGVLFDVYRSSIDFQELIEEGLELGLFQKVVMEILPVWDTSSIRDEGFGGGLHKLMKDLVEKGGFKLPRASPLRITKENVVVVEGYFKQKNPFVNYFNQIPPIMKS